MEITPYSRVCKNLNKHQYQILSSISKYLDTPIYFFGSCIRGDFVKNSSDIDVILFTENIEKTKVMLEEKIVSLSSGILSYKILKMIMDTRGDSSRVTFDYLVRLKLSQHSTIDLVISDIKNKNARLMHDYYVSSKINNNPFLYILLYITKMLYHYGFIHYSMYLQIKRSVSGMYNKAITVMEIKPYTEL
jgi:predicted nucleotidyltransferase